MDTLDPDSAKPALTRPRGDHLGRAGYRLGRRLPLRGPLFMVMRREWNCASVTNVPPCLLGAHTDALCKSDNVTPGLL